VPEKPHVKIVVTKGKAADITLSVKDAENKEVNFITCRPLEYGEKHLQVLRGHAQQRSKSTVSVDK
jgi:hypothetical protein